MSERFQRALDEVRLRIGAAAVLMSEEAPGSGARFVVAVAPAGLVPLGTPLPPQGAALEQLEADRARLPVLLPVALRLALPAPATHAWTQALPDTALQATLAWTQPPPEEVTRALAPWLDEHLRLAAIEFSLRQRLRLENNRLQTVWSALDQAIVTIDGLRQEAMVNPAAERLLGVPAGILPARQVSDALRRFQDGALNHDAAGAIAATLVRQPDATVTGVVWRFAGSPTHVRVTTAPLQGASTHGRIWVFDDISVQMSALQAAEDARTRYRLLAENADDIVFRRSSQGIVEWISESVTAALGWTEQDIVGQPLEAFIDPEDQLRSRAVDPDPEAAVAMPARRVYRARFRRKDGSCRWLEVSTRRVPDADGNTDAWIGCARDVQEQIEAQQRIATSERYFRLLAENSANVVTLLRAGRIDWVSPSLMRTLGWQPEQWLGRPYLDFIHPDDRSLAVGTVSEVATSGARVLRLRVLAPSGRFHWAEVSADAYIGDDGVRNGMVASFRTIDAEVAAEAALARMARFDTLTGLANRTEALNRFAERQSPKRRTGGGSAVLFCDIDRFKAINDLHGHAAGDQTLQVLADRIRGCVRSNDICARMGGDELLVILDGIHALDEAGVIAEKIRVAAEQPIPLGGEQEAITASMSIGVALAGAGETFDQVMARADAAMYEAKKKGRNQVVLVG